MNERGAGNFSYVCGMRGDGPDRISHAWIEGEGVIADITADQFPEIDCPVIVATQSSWHDTFERETAHDADFRIFKDAASAVLAGAYAAILKAL
ncbi:hypothetical protein FJ546_07465 [Mesorhizobium sp. B2-4-19]|uniref:hypothetical protein n=1 Tax=Mesorhizobium sp. B2-4-19 TaxID=2589930 RepID=UPI00112AA84F|nr:hypothetical protein [Mesorhizobium sp. B2-4-19]TPK66582.1 hypothetical protein FJ546_07465 [Mesorhizobium sp. B2-4-19]